MRRAVRVYGSVLVLAVGGSCSALTVALFVFPWRVVDLLGLVGLAALFVGMMTSAVVSLSTDLLGNASELLD